MPLCRRCHEAYDSKRLDLLPALITHGFFAEMAHVISAHQVSPLRLLDRLTANRYRPYDGGGAAPDNPIKEEFWWKS